MWVVVDGTLQVVTILWSMAVQCVHVYTARTMTPPPLIILYCLNTVSSAVNPS